MLPEELLWVIALNDIPTYHSMVTALPQLARKITLGTQCNHKIHFGYDVKVVIMNHKSHNIIWLLNDKLHRIDGPAREFANGSKWYYQDNKLHRIDGPAIERVYGIKEWYLNGKRHRTDGPAVEHANGDKRYYQDNKLYRTDGPAIECVNGYKAYYQNNKLHRTDGHAIELVDGAKAYYLNDISYTLQDYHLMTFSY